MPATGCPEITASAGAGAATCTMTIAGNVTAIAGNVTAIAGNVTAIMKDITISCGRPAAGSITAPDCHAAIPAYKHNVGCSPYGCNPRV